MIEFRSLVDGGSVLLSSVTGLQHLPREGEYISHGLNFFKVSHITYYTNKPLIQIFVKYVQTTDYAAQGEGSST